MQHTVTNNMTPHSNKNVESTPGSAASHGKKVASDKEWDEKPGSGEAQPAPKRKLFNGNTLETPKKKRRTKSSMESPSMILPLTERQQLAYLLELTAKEVQQTVGESHNGHKDSMQEGSDKKKNSKHKSSNSKVNKRNERGEAQLHLTAIKGDVEGVKNLIEQGADVNVRDYAGWTPLHEACNQGHYKIAKSLLRAGANANAKGLEDDTPLHDASSSGHTKIVKLLLKFGADPYQKNQHLKTAIDMACSPEILQMLENGSKNDIHTGVSAVNKENQEVKKRSSAESCVTAEPSQPSLENNVDSCKDLNDNNQLLTAEANDLTETIQAPDTISDTNLDVATKDTSPEVILDVVPSPVKQNDLPEEKDETQSTDDKESLAESGEQVSDKNEDLKIEESDICEHTERTEDRQVENDELSESKSECVDNEEVDEKLSNHDIHDNLDNECDALSPCNDKNSDDPEVDVERECNLKDENLSDIQEGSEPERVESPIMDEFTTPSFEDISSDDNLESVLSNQEEKEDEEDLDHLKNCELFENRSRNDDTYDTVESLHDSDSASDHADPVVDHIDPVIDHVDPIPDPVPDHIDPVPDHVDPVPDHVDPVPDHVDPVPDHVDPVSDHVDLELFDIIDKHNDEGDCCDLNVCDKLTDDSELNNSLSSSDMKYSSELSDEDKHIVNITMEIEESLSRSSANFNSISEKESNNLIEDVHSVHQSPEPFLLENLSPCSVASDTTQSTTLSRESPIELKIGIESTKSPVVSSYSEDPVVNYHCNSIDNNLSINTMEEKSDIKSTVSRTVITHATPSSPSSRRSRTVDLEPRDIVRSVLNVDIDTDCAPIPTRLSPILELPCESSSEPPTKTDCNVKPKELPTEFKTPEPMDSENQDEKTSQKSSMCLRSQKVRSLSPTLPTQWREAMRRYCQTVERSAFPQDYMDFLIVSKGYSANINEIEADQVKEPLTCLARKQRVELERLHLCMEQDLLRTESKYRLVSNNKKAISACNVITYQKEERCKKLREFLKNHTKSVVTEPDKLRKAWMQDIIDKYCKLEDSMLVRHEYERQAIKAEIAASKILELDRKDYLRTKYLPLIRKRIKAGP